MDEIERRAESVLAELPDYIWDGDRPPIPVEEIADSHFGLHVCEKSPAEMRAAPGCPALDDGVTLSGLLLPSLGQIWVNADEAAQWPGRRRFTIAHELGHWVLHRRGQQALFCRKGTVAEDPAPAPREPLPEPEREANAFAAALLMPAPLVERLYARPTATSTASARPSPRAARRWGGACVPSSEPDVLRVWLDDDLVDRAAPDGWTHVTPRPRRSSCSKPDAFRSSRSTTTCRTTSSTGEGSSRRLPRRAAGGARPRRVAELDHASYGQPRRPRPDGPSDSAVRTAHLRGRGNADARGKDPVSGAAEGSRPKLRRLAARQIRSAGSDVIGGGLDHAQPRPVVRPHR